LLSDKNPQRSPAPPGRTGQALPTRYPLVAPAADPVGETAMINKTMMLILAVTVLTALIGCNTIHGVGQDLEAVGEGIQDMTSD
jgi:predicted small secreted protein